MHIPFMCTAIQTFILKRSVLYKKSTIEQNLVSTIKTKSRSRYKLWMPAIQISTCFDGSMINRLHNSYWWKNKEERY